MAAKSSDYRMAIKIAGEIEKSLYNSTDLTRKELNKIAKEAAYASSMTKESFSQGLRETEPFFNGLEKAGVKAFKALAAGAAVAGTAILGIGTASATAGIGFESAFAGVKKTTDATAEEYAQLRQEILGMTREIPATGEEISEIAEAAGQLGIEKENLLSFSRTMIDLGESTNLASTEAASSLAKFANITNMGADNYGRLGSVIVDLGNNFATTEADIVAMATRLASSGELAGFTEEQIMAMSTAMSSVGIEAEAGGSAMSKMIKKVQVAVETGDKSLKKYAAVAGMSVNEFKEAFEKDGLSAVAAFVSGLNDVERNGKSATVILDEMGLTEIRLSNTLLSLASADELMYNAVETANKAWEENTALTKEAALRYETTESKISIMKNGFTEMGIAMYDQFNEPMRDGIDMITELVHTATAEINGSTVIHDITQDIIEGIPSAARIVKTLAETVGDFSQPFLAVGGWLADNPKLLESTVAGIGTALITYKTVKGVESLATAFSSLGAASLPVLGLTGAVAVIGGVTVAVKKSAAEAKKANLDRHFGNITLSMRELEETAAYIVSNDSFGELQESIARLRELDGINDSIEESVAELNRTNWKVAIGMELSEDEQENYKQNIGSYVTDVQKYIEEEQYAVNLAVGVLTGDDLENSNIVTQLNEFYSGKSAELASLGSELNKTVTDAFNDGLLEIEEAEKISELQQEIANIKASLATGTYEANLDLLSLKYSSGEIDADTFMNLQAEINQQMEAAREYYDESYVAAASAQKAALKDGTITQEQYDSKMAEIDSGYMEQVGSLEAKAANFQSQFIRQNYENELGGYIDNMPDALGNMQERLKEMNGLPSAKLEYEIFKKESGISNIDSSTIDAMKDLWKELEPGVIELEKLKQEYIDAGKEIPGYITDGINDGLAIGLIAGDKDVLNRALGQQSIEENYKPIIKSGTKEISEAVQIELNNTFARGFDVQTGINFQFGVTGLPKNLVLQKNVINTEKRANGGLITQPEIALLREAGYDEMVIPIDGSQNAVSLWQQTGELLGVNRKESFQSLTNSLLEDFGSSTSSTVNNSEESNRIVFSPVININGGSADKHMINEALNTAFEEFESMMERYTRNKERYSFS